MADVVNLNRFRKRKAAEARKALADRNAARHGRTKAEKASAKRDQDAQNAKLDGAKLSDDETTDDASDPEPT